MTTRRKRRRDAVALQDDTVYGMWQVIEVLTRRGGTVRIRCAGCGAEEVRTRARLRQSVPDCKCTWEPYDTDLITYCNYWVAKGRKRGGCEFSTAQDMARKLVYAFGPLPEGWSPALMDRHGPVTLDNLCYRPNPRRAARSSAEQERALLAEYKRRTHGDRRT